MEYEYQEVIMLTHKTFAQLSTAFQHIQTLPFSLSHIWTWIPLTEALKAEVNGEHVAITETQQFRGLTEPLQAALLKASYAGGIAYYEHEVIGGEGYAAVIAWKDGSVIFGPLTTLGDHTLIHKAWFSIGYKPGDCFA